LAAIAPGVVGQTGIETAELIRSAVEAISPSVLICIDALAARSVDRLAVTVQLSNTGIAPGSGIGNHRQAINRDFLGIPVIAIGVPTVVDSSTMVYGMLEKAGVTEISEALETELENGRSFFVTLKETDTATAEMARLIARAIQLAFSVTPS
jgi:spore protease